MGKPHILVEATESQDVRRYHLPIEISLTHTREFVRPLSAHRDLHQTLGTIGAVIVKELLTEYPSTGVVSLVIGPYELQVVKGRIFSWEEVEERLLKLLTQLVKGQFGGHEK